MTSDLWGVWYVMPVDTVRCVETTADRYVGVCVRKAALEVTKEDFDVQMDTNLWGVFTVAQAAALCVGCLAWCSQADMGRLWKEHGYQNGRIVFISCMAIFS